MDHDNIIAICNECGAKNRIAKNRLQDKPVCGKCNTPILIIDRPLDITDRTFNKEVLSYPGIVLVDCWAPWCGPCKIVAPLLEELSKEYAGRVKITKLNVDENSAIASKYAIQSIPTMLLFKNGQKVNTLVGAMPKLEIAKQLQAIG